jgi:hypothetical protein
VVAAETIAHNLPWYFTLVVLVVWGTVLVGVFAILRWRRRMRQPGRNAGRSSSRLKGLPAAEPSSAVSRSRRARQ